MNAPASDRNKWHPIETAPKDGSRILAAHWDEVGCYWRRFTVFWNAHFEGGFWQNGGLKENPTVWRELPDGPDDAAFD